MRLEEKNWRKRELARRGAVAKRILPG